MPALSVISSSRGGASFPHRLDIRTKLAISLLASIVVIVMTHPAALAVLSAASALYVVSLKRVRIILIVYAVVIMMWAVAVAMMTGMHMLWPHASPLEWDRLSVPFLRTVVMVNTALPLALSSRTQSFLAAFKALRLPFCIYVPLAVMIRFIPTFIEDVRQIRECVKTRGHTLTIFSFFAHPFLTVRLVLMPLLFRSLRSSDELGVAAELKGLGSVRSMTPLYRARFGQEDAVMACLVVAVLVPSVVLQVVLKGSSGGGMF